MIINISEDLTIEIYDDVKFLISKATNFGIVISDEELPKLIQALQQVQKMKESGE